jgi:hypothetical protein
MFYGVENPKWNFVQLMVSTNFEIFLFLLTQFDFLLLLTIMTSVMVMSFVKNDLYGLFVINEIWFCCFMGLVNILFIHFL